MNWKVSTKIKYYCSALVFINFIAILIRVFLGEPYYISSSSMEPGHFNGDLVWVNKINYGAKLPTRFADIPLFNVFTWIPYLKNKDEALHWPYIRIPGFQNPEIGDIIVFNSVEDSNLLLAKRVHDKLQKGLQIELNLFEDEKLHSILKYENKTYNIEN